MNETAAKVLASRTGWLLNQPCWLREAVLAGSRLRTFRAGEFAFHVGDEPGGMYGVVDGGFSVLLPSGGVGLLPCHILRRGNWFGHGPALGGAGRTLTFRATEPTRALHLPLREVNAIAAARPEFYRILGALTETNFILLAAAIIGDLLIPSGEQRIAAVLARNARPQPSAEPQLPWPIRLSQAEVAQMSNSSRDRVNRTLARFEKAGWITADFKMIVINDLRALENFATRGSDKT